jgi:hypothetical protein
MPTQEWHFHPQKLKRIVKVRVKIFPWIGAKLLMQDFLLLIQLFSWISARKNLRSEAGE